MEDKISLRSHTRAFGVIITCAFWLATNGTAQAFCGFYAGKADAQLYNHASQVAIVRHDDKTVISLMNDYQGPLAQFALVVPVPSVLEKDQIHIGDPELFRRLDDYSAPRLVEYNDPSPCPSPLTRRESAVPAGVGAALGAIVMSRQAQANSLGVKVEAQYTVGEYDIVILSAEQSDGLEEWLHEGGYYLPKGAAAALRPYIKQKTKFFVAKVNLSEQSKTGLSYLRPLQFAFESPKFMLPIRLGMLNAQGRQDLVIYAMTESGRVETTNYRTVKAPSGMDVSDYVRDDFANFYKAMFSHQVDLNDMTAVFTEYVWNMAWCDPCAAAPLSRGELRSLGVFWLGEENTASWGGPGSRMIEQAPVILTRLHVRYAAATFPEDLVFQETQDRENFQARYVIRHPWTGATDACPEAQSYFENLRQRQQTEAATVADLTGWDLRDVYREAGIDPASMPKTSAWWENLWH